MKKKITPILVLSLVMLLLLSSANCFWIKAKYDPQGQQYAVTIQKETMTLLEKCNEPYRHHRKAVHHLLTMVEAAYDHARTMIKNDSVTGIWDVQRNPYANRLAAFLEEWKVAGILSKEKIATYKKWLEKDFQLLIELEEKKKK